MYQLMSTQTLTLAKTLSYIYSKAESPFISTV